MAILDGLLLDNLLEGIVKSEVFIALRSDFRNDPNRFGAGIAGDPYDGSKVGTTYKLDAILAALPANSTIYLGPGVYPTKGNQAWSPKSGWRMMGAGWAGRVEETPGIGVTGATVLKLEGHVTTGGGENFAVACGTAEGEELDGFEMGYLSIDAGFPASGNLAAGGINVNGRHIRIHHVRVFNFGSRVVPGHVLTAARPSSLQPDVVDVVVSDCVIEEPSANSTGTVTCLRFCVDPDEALEGSVFHRMCVLARNYVNCGDNGITYDFRGISAAGGAAGTIVEENRIWNCRYGFYADRNSGRELDLILRDNLFFIVRYGIVIDLEDIAWATGRSVIQSNLIELIPDESPMGIKLAGEGQTVPYRFAQTVIRLNQIRHGSGVPGDEASIGITIDSVESAIIEENLINLGDPESPTNPTTTNGVRRSGAVLNIKTFNNQRTDGTFLGCWNLAANQHDGDLVTDIEDMALVL